jgi:hypothetical protein
MVSMRRREGCRCEQRVLLGRNAVASIFYLAKLISYDTESEIPAGAKDASD